MIIFSPTISSSSLSVSLSFCLSLSILFSRPITTSTKQHPSLCTPFSLYIFFTLHFCSLPLLVSLSLSSFCRFFSNHFTIPPFTSHVSLFLFLILLILTLTHTFSLFISVSNNFDVYFTLLYFTLLYSNLLTYPHFLPLCTSL